MRRRRHDEAVLQLTRVLLLEQVVHRYRLEDGAVLVADAREALPGQHDNRAVADKHDVPDVGQRDALALLAALSAAADVEHPQRAVVDGLGDDEARVVGHQNDLLNAVPRLWRRREGVDGGAEVPHAQRRLADHGRHTVAQVGARSEPRHAGVTRHVLMFLRLQVPHCDVAAIVGGRRARGDGVRAELVDPQLDDVIADAAADGAHVFAGLAVEQLERVDLVDPRHLRLGGAHEVLRRRGDGRDAAGGRALQRVHQLAADGVAHSGLARAAEGVQHLRTDRSFISGFMSYEYSANVFDMVCPLSKIFCTLKR